MARYDYRCRTCDRVFEVRRPMTEATTRPSCPDGHQDVARVWSAVAVTGRASSLAPQPAPSTAGGGCCGGGCCG